MSGDSSKRYVTEVVLTSFEKISEPKPISETEDLRSIKELAQEVLSIQDACNSTAVSGAMNRAMKRLLRLLNNTDEVNQHPITGMYIDKLVQLNEAKGTDYSIMYEAVAKLAEK